MIQILDEVAPEVQLDERGGQEVDRVIECWSKGEVGESRWKEFNWVVENAAEVEFFEVGWEIVYRLVEIRSKRETSEGVRKSTEGCITEKFGELRREGMWSVAGINGDI